MAKLGVEARRGLKAAQFALPGKRTDKGGEGGWPMPDKKHASFALTQIGRSEKAGNLSPAGAAVIRAKADKKLGK